jgi:hypothetical protein
VVVGWENLFNLAIMLVEWAEVYGGRSDGCCLIQASGKGFNMVEAKLYAYHKSKRSDEDNRGLVAEAKFSDLSGVKVWIEEETATGYRGRWVSVSGFSDWAEQFLNDFEYGHLTLKCQGHLTRYITIHNNKDNK